MKQLYKYIRGLYYKLTMMGIPVESPTFIYGNNQSVLANTSIPESALKKKSQSLAYYLMREGVAHDEQQIAYINTNENEADLLTKVLSCGKKKVLICTNGPMLYFQYYLGLEKVYSYVSL